MYSLMVQKCIEQTWEGALYLKLKIIKCNLKHVYHRTLWCISWDYIKQIKKLYKYDILIIEEKK